MTAFGRMLSLSMLAGTVTLAAAPRFVPPGPGVFLVARQSVEGGPFWHSVVLLLAHGDEGTLGVIINRATEIPLSKVLSDLDSKESGDPPLNYGGPVALDGLIFLFESPTPSKDAGSVMGDVYFSGKRELLEKLLKKKDSPNRLRVFVGHAGWSAGQLQGEIARGSWSLVPADAFTVFQKSPDAIWPELARSEVTVADGVPAFPGAGRAEAP